MYRDIVKLLSHTETAITYDKGAFENYAKGKATLEETIRVFMYNNNIMKRDLIDSRLFKDWLDSLGYKRDV